MSIVRGNPALIFDHKTRGVAAGKNQKLLLKIQVVHTLIKLYSRYFKCYVVEIFEIIRKQIQGRTYALSMVSDVDISVLRDNQTLNQNKVGQ